MTAGTSTPGTVYLFNLGKTQAHVTLNDVGIGPIPGFGDASSGYQPAFIPVPRVNLNDPCGGKFRESTNTIKIAWSGVQSTADDFYIPYGPDGVDPDQDLVSFLTKSQGLVFTTQGFATKPTTFKSTWTLRS